ncbi:MAG TPA: tetratricopeptide repeat protein [Actinoplanes sp.]|nr:tetratricopeptide repeat protein [Actinoplanes sp.]
MTRTDGDVLRKRRITLGWTQQELARKAGVSVRSVRNLERGAGGPQTVRQLMSALGLTEVDGTGQRRTGIRVSVLGPLTVHVDGAEVPVRSSMQRRLLVLLALHPGQTVRTAEIVEALWGDRPPATHPNLIHVYVGALRRLLAPSAIVTGPDGYRLGLDRERIDLARFDDLVRRAGLGDDAYGDYELALGCWRGPVDPLAGQHPTAVAVSRQRIVATLAFADLAIESRRYDSAMRRLEPLSRTEPLHEGLHARLVLALAGSGRQAEALHHYADVRARIVRELGVEPGPQLTGAHLGVLRQELPGAPARPNPVIPAELPPATACLAGRAAALQSLDRLLLGAGEGRPAPIVAISGGPGTGKTTLAVHWAHSARGHFPDGQLFVNLRGFHPSGPVVSADQVMRMFLESLGVAPGQIPQSPDGQGNLYRSLLAARRVLVVLDNARDAEHVRPLLPGSGGSAAVVTSRNRLTGLVAVDGGTAVGLSALTPEGAAELVSRRLGADRIAAEPEAAAEIGRLCGYLPLALAIVAARAVVQAELPLAAFVTHLRAERDRLDALGGDEATIDVRAIFSWSYGVLSPAAARLFRLLGTHIVTDIGPGAAAALAGCPVDGVRAPLAELVRGSLLDETPDGRYTMHDLLRVYALETAAAEDPAAEREAATGRMLNHYVSRAVGASRGSVNPRLGSPPVAPAGFRDRDEAAAWFAAERQNLLTAQVTADTAGLDEQAWWLGWALSGYLQRSGHWQDGAETSRIALFAARRLGDVQREIYADRNLGVAYARLGDFDKATPCYQRALTLYERCGDLAEAATTHLNLGWVADRRHDVAVALDHARQALALSRAVGDVRVEADALNTVGWYLIRLGEHRAALEPCREALALHLSIDHRAGQADTWDTIGYAHHHLGDHQQAVAAYREALPLYVAVSDRYHESLVLNHMGDSHRAAGDVAAAGDRWQEALRILDDLEHAEAAEVRAKIIALAG